MAFVSSRTLKGYELNRRFRAHLFPPQFPTISSNGCVLYLPLNRVFGNTVKDLSGYGNNGTVSGAVLQNIGKEYGLKWRGKITTIGGKALSFDGVDDYMEVPDSSSLDITNEITLETWINLLSWVDYPRFFHKYDATYSLVPYEFGGNQASAYFYFAITTSSNRVAVNTGTNSVVLERWYHLVGTYDGSRMKVYLNGELKGNTSQSGLILTNANPLLFGRRAATYVNQTIAEVRIYNRALSAEEISKHYKLLKPMFA